jgi:hypothetical protein
MNDKDDPVTEDEIKRSFNDEKLNKLLTPAEGEVITFFNLQTHLKRHFGPIKKTVTESVTVV